MKLYSDHKAITFKDVIDEGMRGSNLVDIKFDEVEQCQYHTNRRLSMDRYVSDNAISTYLNGLLDLCAHVQIDGSELEDDAKRLVINAIRGVIMDKSVSGPNAVGFITNLSAMMGGSPSMEDICNECSAFVADIEPKSHELIEALGTTEGKEIFGGCFKAA